MVGLLARPLLLTLVFLGVVVSLGAAFVWVFWEIERTTSKPHRKSDGIG